MQQPHDSTWLPLEPEIEHKPAVLCVSIDQLTPAPDPAGNGSLTVTPAALPVPLFLTVTVNPIGSPAFTDAASAVFVTVTFAGWHAIDAEAVPPPSLVELAVAVLS